MTRTSIARLADDAPVARGAPTIKDAVSAAIKAGMTPKQFRKLAESVADDLWEAPGLAKVRGIKRADQIMTTPATLPAKPYIDDTPVMQRAHAALEAEAIATVKAITEICGLMGGKLRDPNG